MKNEVDQKYESDVNRALERLEHAYKSNNPYEIQRASAELEHARGGLKSENYNNEDQ